MKQIILIMFLTFMTASLIAQEYKIPTDYKLETKNDYINLEQDVVKAVDWLINKPLNQEQDKRNKVNAFLLKWLTGTPTISIEVKQEVVTFLDCSDCLMIYMGGYAKNAILNKERATILNNNIEAIKDVIIFYNKNKSLLGKNKAIEKYIKLKKKGKLEKYLKSRV